MRFAVSYDHPIGSVGLEHGIFGDVLAVAAKCLQSVSQQADAVSQCPQLLFIRVLVAEKLMLPHLSGVDNRYLL